MALASPRRSMYFTHVIPFPPLILPQAKSRQHHFVASSALLCPPEPGVSHFRSFRLFAQKTYVLSFTSGRPPQTYYADILNQINPSGPKPKTDPGKSTDPGPQSQLDGARHFVKFVFPRQHGLPNPFVTIENTAPFHDRQIEAAISVCARVRVSFTTN